jgi:hypothetical protein
MGSAAPPGDPSANGLPTLHRIRRREESGAQDHSFGDVFSLEYCESRFDGLTPARGVEEGGVQDPLLDVLLALVGEGVDAHE